MSHGRGLVSHIAGGSVTHGRGVVSHMTGCSVTRGRGVVSHMAGVYCHKWLGCSVTHDRGLYYCIVQLQDDGKYLISKY